MEEERETKKKKDKVAGVSIRVENAKDEGKSVLLFEMVGECAHGFFKKKNQEVLNFLEFCAARQQKNVNDIRRCAGCKDSRCGSISLVTA